MEKKKQSGLEQFIQDVIRLMRYAGKPSREEVYQVTKIIILSLLAIGAIGFILKLVMQAIVGA